jgi:outer membrane lipoprotein SlyB
MTGMKSFIRTQLYSLSLFSVVVSLQGCAPELGLKVKAPSLPDPAEAAQAQTVVDPVKVRIGTFTDARPSQTFVTIDGRDVTTQGSVVGPVQEGFATYLRHAGMRIALLNAPTIEGQVTDWRANVSASFPTSDAKATARLKVTVRDSRSHPIYHATFSGEASTSHPMLDDQKIQELLGQAMASAIEAATLDQTFMAQLAKGRID